MAEITTTEAISLAERYKNHFKAFEKIGEVLILAAQAEQTVTEKERAKAVLEKEILKLKTEVAGHNGKALQSAAGAKEAAERFAVETTQLQQGFDSARATAEQNQTAFLKNLERIGHKAADDHKVRVTKMEQEQRDIQARTDTLQASLDALLEQVKKSGEPV